MGYELSYACVSHAGLCRRTNQDNFICGGAIAPLEGPAPDFPLAGRADTGEPELFGIFDGLGGEQKGETAAWIAAKNAQAQSIGRDPERDLMELCRRSNEEICRYVEENGLLSMGTTAVMLVFFKKRVTLCNIGDSKAFLFRDGALRQLSQDHLQTAVFGRKPPLLQNLGIPPTELAIKPYFSRERARAGDIYLLCSDGLTDMVPEEAIAEVLSSGDAAAAAGELLDRALAAGGRDNVTVLLCKVERRPGQIVEKHKIIEKRHEHGG